MCLLFSGEEKRSKKVAGDNYCGCVPGLKPRVAIINCSPLWLQTVHRTVCGARHARNAFLVSAKPCRVAPLNSFRCERKQTIVLLLLGQAFVGCPNKMAAGASPPYEKDHLYMTNEIIRFKIYHLPLLQITIGQPRTSVPTILSVA